MARVTHAAALMLAHLVHHVCRDTAEALPLVGDEWTVLHFPDADRAKKPKAVLYGRMWGFRKLGYDAMVRQLPDGSYVLVARRFG